MTNQASQAAKRNQEVQPAAASHDVAQQQHYLHQATAANTRRAYQAAIRQFERHGGLLPATEQSIAQYITMRAQALNPRTLSLHLTALSHCLVSLASLPNVARSYPVTSDPKINHRDQAPAWSAQT